MSWRLAKSLLTLRDQINAKWPGRSKASDGTVGDLAHASRKSDHNPLNGVVHALDITHDPANGVDAGALAEAIRASHDPRIKYIISNARIASERDDWAWRPYSGANAHRHHVHFSVKAGALADDISPWMLDAAAPAHPTLKRGDRGSSVRELQFALNRHAYALMVDGDFGARTERAVIAFQQARGLVPDGVAGPRTWGALGG